MTIPMEYFKIHPEHPQSRLIGKTIEILNRGGVMAYPTDSGYALGCHIGDKSALQNICRIRQLDDKHQFSIMCKDISQVSVYAHFDTPVYRLLKAATPGPYTFILRASREVPKRLIHIKRKTIGIRIPDIPIVQAILDQLGEPFFTTSFILPGEEFPMNDTEEIRDRFGHQLDVVIDGGQGSTIPTTLVDMTEDAPVILREGRGDVQLFQ